MRPPACSRTAPGAPAGVLRRVGMTMRTGSASAAMAAAIRAWATGLVTHGIRHDQHPFFGLYAATRFDGDASAPLQFHRLHTEHPSIVVARRLSPGPAAGALRHSREGGQTPDHVCRLLGDHHGRGAGVRGRHVGHDRGIRNAQSRPPREPAVRRRQRPTDRLTGPCARSPSRDSRTRQRAGHSRAARHPLVTPFPGKVSASKNRASSGVCGAAGPRACPQGEPADRAGPPGSLAARSDPGRDWTSGHARSPRFRGDAARPRRSCRDSRPACRCSLRDSSPA